MVSKGKTVFLKYMKSQMIEPLYLSLITSPEKKIMVHN